VWRGISAAQLGRLLRAASSLDGVEHASAVAQLARSFIQSAGLMMACIMCVLPPPRLLPPLPPPAAGALHRAHSGSGDGASSARAPALAAQFTRPILTEIFLCHACSCQELLSDHIVAHRRGRSRCAGSWSSGKNRALDPKQRSPPSSAFFG
jgi:hypothetical protein